ACCAVALAAKTLSFRHPRARPEDPDHTARPERGTTKMTATALERAERRKACALALPALLWTGFFFLLPFAFMPASTLASRQGREIVATWTLDNYIAFFEKAHLFKGLVVSLEITAAVTVISVLLAYPLAWIIAERVPKKWQRFALVMAILPFWTSYVVRSYS